MVREVLVRKICLIALFLVVFSIGCFAASPDVNVAKIDGYDDLALPIFRYSNDGNLTIDFNIYDVGNLRVDVDINYSTSSVQGTGTSIVTDLNVTAAMCSGGDIDWADVPSTCSWDWNIHYTKALDNNYYILIEATNSGAASDFNASDGDFAIDNITNFTETNQTLEALALSGMALGDIDNDGDLDMINTGIEGGGGTSTLVYTNTGDGNFILSAQSLLHIQYGTPGLGDLDNDGDLDLVLSGQRFYDNYIMPVYTNNGDGNFTLSSQTLPELDWSGMDFGDIDGDGDLDLVAQGEKTNHINSTFIYTNTGDGNFVETNQNKTGLDEGSVSIGDIDNDGDLDLIQTGSGLTLIYTNNGDGNFTLSNQNKLGIRYGSVSLGDIDNDGDLDMVMTGAGNDSAAYTLIYTNNGDGNFTLSDQNKTGLAYGAPSLGDIDNDGSLDLIIIGNNNTLIYINNGDGNFSDTSQELEGWEYGAPLLGDIDNDGDLDLLISGQRDGWDYDIKIYTSDQADLGAFEDPNTPPSPSTTEFFTEYLDGQFNLHWGPGTDANTPADGLYYNIKVGTTPDANDLVSPYFGSHGGYLCGFNGQFGNMMQRQDLNLGIPRYTIYWAVQTIDASFDASAWGATQSYINAVPDVNVWLIEDIDVFTSAMPFFAYDDDLNITIDFNVFDPYNDRLTADINFSITNSQGTGTPIFTDLNLTSFYCTDQDWNDTASKCSVDLNIYNLADENYYILIEVDDGVYQDFNATGQSFGVDNNAPTTSYDGNHNEWQIDTNITLTCHDNGSGCSTTAWRLDVDPTDAIAYGDWNTSNSVNIPTPGAGDGNYAIDFNSTDNAGNVGDTNTFTVLIDRTAPTTSWERSLGDANITLTCHDANSGCDQTIWRIDTNSDEGVNYGPWTEGTQITVPTAAGSYAAEFYSTDQAGNTGDVNSIDLIVSTTTTIIDCPTCVEPDPYCGDDACDKDESWLLCPEDCIRRLLPPPPPAAIGYLGKVAPLLLGRVGKQQVIIETTGLTPQLQTQIISYGFCPELRTEEVIGGTIDGENIASIAAIPQILSIQPEITAQSWSAEIEQVKDYLMVTPIATGGEGIGIAILDTGANCNLPKIRCDLQYNVVELQAAGTCQSREPTRNAFDTVGHGTSINYIIHAVSPEATITPIKVCNEYGCNTMRIIKGLELVRNDPTIQVVNLSLGIPIGEIESYGLQPSEYILNKEIQRTINAGKIVVAAAGNCSGKQYVKACPSPGCQAWGPTCPAAEECVKDVIGVGAINYRAQDEIQYGGLPDETIACFSSQGSAQVVAPGFVIAPNHQGRTRDAIGTSFSAPIVTGIVANAVAAQGLTPVPLYTNSAVVKKAIEDSAKDLGPPGPDDVFGYGLVQANRIDLAGTANMLILQLILLAIILFIITALTVYYVGYKGAYKKGLSGAKNLANWIRQKT